MPSSSSTRAKWQHSTMHRNELASRKPDAGIAYENEIYERGLRYQRPVLTFQSSEWERLACERLSAEAKGYVYGSAGMRETEEKNREAFKKWSIVPRRLVKMESFPKLQTRVFGETLDVPIAIAPVGVQKIFNPDGELAVARAARATNVPFIYSTAASATVEEVAEASGKGKRWFQLYWPNNKHHDITISLLARAKQAGYTTLFVTLDTYILGWRPSDMDNGYNPFMRADQIGVALGFSDPVFRKKFKQKHGKEVDGDAGLAASEWMHTVFPGMSHSWEDLKVLKDHWGGPVVLKGIQSVGDAKKAANMRIQGVVVSNHGGRQQDGGNSSLGMLPHIVDAVKGKLTIFFDSGVRCGADIAKALALGADCVLIGRPYVYGLALGGQEGVEHVLKSLIGDLELTLHLAGITSVDKKVLNRGCLVREDDLLRTVEGIGIH